MCEMRRTEVDGLYLRKNTHTHAADFIRMIRDFVCFLHEKDLKEKIILNVASTPFIARARVVAENLFFVMSRLILWIIMCQVNLFIKLNFKNNFLVIYAFCVVL